MALDSGEAVQYRWDAAGRLAETTDPQGETTYFGYDAAGRRSRATYGNGTSASYGYDAVGQVLSIVYSDAAGGVQTAFGYGYDAAGNRTYKAQADGSKEVYGYDGLNRLTGVDYPGGRHVEYGYDGVGNRQRVTDTAKTQTRWGASAIASSEHWYYGGAAGALAPDGAAWMPLRTDSKPQWVEVTYGQAERSRGLRVLEKSRSPSVVRVDLIEESGASHTVFDGGDQTKDGAWLALSFDLTAYKVKKARVWTVPSTILGGGYPEQIDAIGVNAVGVDTYQYNGFNQLTGIAGSDGTSSSFGYDGNGNQVRKTETPAGGAGQVTQYVYNQDNRLTGIALPNGGSNAFEYDANGLRTKKTDSSGISSYLLDGLSVVAQYAPGGTRQAWYTQSLARIDEVLNVVNSTGKYWYQADALGSVYALTTSTGAVQARGGYDVFGAPQAVSGASVGQPFGFTGREHEGESGLVYSRARYLSPGAGGWLSEDPINLRTAQLPLGTERWISTGGVGLADALVLASRLERYGYGANNPARYADPSGELLADTVRQGLSMAAGVLAITAFFSMLPMLLIFQVAMAVELFDLARAAADTLVGLAVTIVVSAGVMILLSPEAIGAAVGLYPALAYAAGFLMCLGMLTVKWVNGGCKAPGLKEGYGLLLCTATLGIAMAAGDPWRLLRPNLP